MTSRQRIHYFKFNILYRGKVRQRIHYFKFNILYRGQSGQIGRYLTVAVTGDLVWEKKKKKSSPIYLRSEIVKYAFKFT